MIRNMNPGKFSMVDIRNAIFGAYYPKHYRIVMLGDSITAGVAWNELLGISDIANRGIAGDTTDGFFKRLTSVYAIKPEMCFIMGGINDLVNEKASVESILINMKKITEALLENGIKPMIQSTLYVSKEWPDWEPVNNAVDELNRGLITICQETVKSAKLDAVFIDVNAALAPEGILKNEYTYDGVHLSGPGYKEWGTLLLPICYPK